MNERTFKLNLKKWEKLRYEAIEASRKVSQLRSRLAENCPHPSTYIHDYRWEYDDGYGRQHWRTGKQCNICYKKDLWNTGRFEINTNV